MNDCIRVVNNSFDRIELCIELIKSEEIKEKLKEIISEEKTIVEKAFKECTINRSI
jgi:hypothetical protein